MWRSDATIRAAKAVDLVALAQLLGVPLQREGRVYKTCCPFHSERTPSFTMYPDTNSFYCFGCGVSGDPIDFVRQVRGWSFREAVQQLTGEMLPRSEPTSADRPTHLPNPDWTTAQLYWHRQLGEYPQAMRYLLSRGVSHAVIRDLQIGYCPPTGWPPGLSSRQGLATAQGCRFAHMLVIPDWQDNQVVALAGRGLDTKRFTLTPGPKRIVGRDTLRGSRWVLIVEGLFDYLAARSWQMPVLGLLGNAAVATLGPLLPPPLTHLILALDADPTGLERTRLLMDHYQDRYCLQRLVLPSGVKDVNDLTLLPDGPQWIQERVTHLLTT